ncbi:interferon-induced protein with tetratricopeptide repeats 5-like [Sardina pilchardus]|uniref:interferon-induced protein with tetratricopeptide repeats 5-like n=1 Tax=Sardina pilchardus TaxID=27697 RepID=UPI002E13E603
MSADKVTCDDKLKNLECLFTWDVNKDDISDLKGVPEKLLDRVKYCSRRYHGTYFNILAFVSHLQGRNDTALEYLAKSEAVLKEEKRDEAEFLVTYSSFTWLHHHLGNVEDMETYLGKVMSIGEGGETIVEAEKGWSFIRLGAKFYPRAKESFQKALETKPGSISYNVGYAIVLYRLEGLVRKDVKDMPEDSPAARQLQRALDLDPTDAEVMVLLALKHQGFDALKSRELVITALEKSPDMPQIIRYAGTYFRRDNSTAESLEMLEEAAKRAPNCALVYHQMGLIHWREIINMKTSIGRKVCSVQVMPKESAECIRLFRKTVELKPSNTHAWVHLAEAYAESRQLEKAEPIFTRLVSDERLTDTERQHCHTKYGVFLLFQRKDDDRAVEQLKKAYRIRIDSKVRNQARDKLEKIGSRWLIQRPWESDDIFAFMSAVDDQDNQDSATRAITAESNASGLADSLTRMTL